MSPAGAATRSSLPSNTKPGNKLRQTDISRYARVTKPSAAHTSKPCLPATNPASDHPSLEKLESTSTKKRKRDVDDHGSPVKIGRKHADPLYWEDEDFNGPREKQKDFVAETRRISHLPTPERTPEKSFRLITSVIEAIPKTPTSLNQNADDTHISAKRDDFIQLVAALLKATSLHLAHHGSVGLINCKDLAQSATKIWKKRKVTSDDIRRSTIALELCNKVSYREKQASVWNFRLIDEGSNKLYLECKSPSVFTWIPESNIKTVLEEVLSQSTPVINALWDPNPSEEGAATENVDELVDRSDPPAPALYSKAPLANGTGQDRLTELLLARKSANGSSSNKDREKRRPSLGVRARSQGLLERMEAKEKQRQLESAGPTPEQLKRIASLHRIADVVYVLSTPRAGKKRLSYPLPTITKTIQSSLHIPLSADEIQSCLKLLADELAIGFIRLIKSGEGTVVVVDQAGKPADLDQRVRNAHRV